MPQIPNEECDSFYTHAVGAISDPESESDARCRLAWGPMDWMPAERKEYSVYRKVCAGLTFCENAINSNPEMNVETERRIRVFQDGLILCSINMETTGMFEDHAVPPILLDYRACRMTLDDLPDRIAEVVGGMTSLDTRASKKPAWECLFTKVSPFKWQRRGLEGFLAREGRDDVFRRDVLKIIAASLLGIFPTTPGSPERDATSTTTTTTNTTSTTTTSTTTTTTTTPLNVRRAVYLWFSARPPDAREFARFAHTHVVMVRNALREYVLWAVEQVPALKTWLSSDFDWGLFEASVREAGHAIRGGLSVYSNQEDFSVSTIFCDSTEWRCLASSVEASLSKLTKTYFYTAQRTFLAKAGAALTKKFGLLNNSSGDVNGLGRALAVAALGYPMHGEPANYYHFLSLDDPAFAALKKAQAASESNDKQTGVSEAIKRIRNTEEGMIMGHFFSLCRIRECTYATRADALIAVRQLAAVLKHRVPVGPHSGGVRFCLDCKRLCASPVMHLHDWIEEYQRTNGCKRKRRRRNHPSHVLQAREEKAKVKSLSSLRGTWEQSRRSACFTKRVMFDARTGLISCRCKYPKNLGIISIYMIGQFLTTHYDGTVFLCPICSALTKISARCTAGGTLSCGCHLIPKIERRYACSLCTDNRVLESKVRFHPFIDGRGGIKMFPICSRHTLSFLSEIPKVFTIREVRKILSRREDYRQKRTPGVRRIRRR